MIILSELLSEPRFAVTVALNSNTCQKISLFFVNDTFFDNQVGVVLTRLFVYYL